MADTKNTEVPPASAPPAPATASPLVTTPVAVRETRSWTQPLVAALVVVVALVIGGVGGFALAGAVHSGGRPALEQGAPHPAVPGMNRPGDRAPQWQSDRHPGPPGAPSGDSGSDSDSDGDGEGSTAG